MQLQQLWIVANWNACHFDAKYCNRTGTHQRGEWNFLTTHLLWYNLEELQLKLVPIPLIEQTFRVDTSDILPKDKSTSIG